MKWHLYDYLDVCMVFFLFAILPACITRGKIDAAIWLNNTPIPKELCEKTPELKDYGFFRRLNSGQLEFVSFCSPQAVQWLAMFKDDFNRLMDEAGLPRPSPTP